MCAEGGIAITAGVVAGSIALVGFGIDSAIEGFASAIIVWRFTGSRIHSEAAERRAQKLVAIQFFLLAPYVAVEAVHRLITGERPDVSWLGMALTASSLIGMPLLGVAKVRLAHRLGSAATKGEGNQNLLCAYLAGAVLIGLVANAAFGLWWLDPVAALAIAGIAVREGMRRGAATAAARHRNWATSARTSAVESSAQAPSRTGTGLIRRSRLRARRPSGAPASRQLVGVPRRRLPDDGVHRVPARNSTGSPAPRPGDRRRRGLRERAPLVRGHGRSRSRAPRSGCRSSRCRLAGAPLATQSFTTETRPPDAATLRRRESRNAASPGCSALSRRPNRRRGRRAAASSAAAGWIAVGASLVEAAGTAPASAEHPPDACYECSLRSRISATGSVGPRGTSPAPYPPEDVPRRPRVLPPEVIPLYEAANPGRGLPGATPSPN